LPSEEDGRQPTINYFNKYLNSWITDPDIHIAFAVIWQNWSNNRDKTATDPDDGYFIPVYKDSPAGKDFINYTNQKNVLMLNDFNSDLKRFKNN
jgi:hypothetical protein